LRRDVSYTNLPPRRYAFHVRAANSDGIWNDKGATLEFILAPAYFQTIWFMLLCIVAALACVVILFRMRLRSAKRNMRMRYDERIEERARIAQGLHDHLIQEMVGIGMQLETADALTPEDVGAKKPLERAVTLSRSAIASGRLTLQTLRSRPTTGPALVETLRTTAEAYAQTDRAPIQYLVEGEDRTLCAEVGEQVSEIGQEALRNALKHAGSGAITVQLHFGALLLDLRVRDEGPGIDEAVLRTGVPRHFGLAGMRERAASISASLTIESTHGRGTTVHVSVPAQRAYDSGPGADAAIRRQWPLWRPWRRWREEKVK
jgi:signal transduction histidine kinase